MLLENLEQVTIKSGVLSMASMLKALKQGMDSYTKAAKTMTQHNVVKGAYDGAKMRGQNPVKAAGKALGAGALTFLVPPVPIGMAVVHNYKQQKVAESQQHRIASLTSCLQSHGISPQGATEIAWQIVNNSSAGYLLTQKDFAMWNLLMSRESSYIQYASRVADRVDDGKPRPQLG